MAASPNWKIYSEAGQYRGCVKDPSDAAAVVALYGDGATIRFGHLKRDTCWIEGTDGKAGDSYDAVAIRCYERLDEIRADRDARLNRIKASWPRQAD